MLKIKLFTLGLIHQCHFLRFLRSPYLHWIKTGLKQCLWVWILSSRGRYCVHRYIRVQNMYFRTIVSDWMSVLFYAVVLTGLVKRCHFFVYTIDRCVRVIGIQQRSRSMPSDKSNQAGCSDYTRCLLTIGALFRDKFGGDLINKHAFSLRHYRCTKHTCI